MKHTLIRAAAFFILATLPFVAQAQTSARPFKEIKLRQTPFDESVLYHYKKQLYFHVGFDHSEGSSDTGLKFIFLEKQGEELMPLWESTGSGTSHILIPHYFQTKNPSDPLLVLAEIGMASSWGDRVFLVDSSGRVTDCGILAVGVEIKGQMVDPIPFLKAEMRGDDIVFTFTRDVVLDPQGKKIRTSKGKVTYVLSKGQLKQVAR